MTLIRCTQKLRKEMGVQPSDLQEASDDLLLGDWYAHLFFQERKKCIFFVAEKTLLCFLATNLSRESIRHLDDVFRDGLFRLLLDEGFQPEQTTRIFDQCRTVDYGVNVDRSMTGTVNELIKEVQFWLPRHGGAINPDLATLNHKLNRTCMKRNKYVYAIKMTKAILASP